MTAKKILLLFLALIILLTPGCGDDDDNNNLNISEFEIWSGPVISFNKANGADPNEAANQDRITGNVWITRGNNGGQIYNAVIEASANKDASPAGTLWALGTTANINDLTFTNFRAAIRPQAVVNREMVMLLVEDKIAIDVVFTSWPGSQVGGFAYDRSTP